MPKAPLGEQSLVETTAGRVVDRTYAWNDDIDYQADPTTENVSIGAARPNANSSPKNNAKHRFGLPRGFVSRINRYGRSVLFEDNVYRLPNGLEFIPQPPTGPLGSRNHQYALLTLDQYQANKRGSVYVRSDGRIFDYSFDHNLAEREMFDTGFSIHDLERTGAYAPGAKLGTRRLQQRASAWKRKKKTRSRSKR